MLQSSHQGFIALRHHFQGLQSLAHASVGVYLVCSRCCQLQVGLLCLGLRVSIQLQFYPRAFTQRRGTEMILGLLCLGAIQTAPCIPRTNTPLPPSSMEMADPYISCTTDTVPNGLDVRCIHACISLCHCPTNSLHIFFRSSYVIYNEQGALVSTERKP